ncbi:ArnT family glycosyltransferase [Halorientalis brevis]|uniref:ArnT family glycosyltransferase n=1 Tax=Halorientalis brevis TaxID=1126241 RepID=A0ABD6CH05_9EURY|nr:glycosyltransferase family 39 protein [Halorientalis brevis]
MQAALSNVRRRTWRVALLVLALAGATAVWLLATRVFPYHSLNHDEAVYLQQAAMLLDGRLFLTPPVDGAFRPWFFVRDGGHLYPKYAPVPAAVFALGTFLGQPRLALAGVGAANVVLVALVVRELFDRRTGLLAAAFVLCSPLFLVNSAVFLPYAPTAMFNLAFAYCYLRADREQDLRWAAGAGVAVGLAFFARPYTAVLFAAPFVAHALWTLRTDRREVLPRHAVTATLGLLGVATALGYNALVTGSPVTFPYEAFAPHDGLGFGHRQILGHEVEYTPGLAVQSNLLVLAALATTWLAGGLLGTTVAAVGLAVAVNRGLSSRQAIVVGQLFTIVVGNVYFWGNYNILGDLDRVGDGLIATHGPYYHFDLLLPFGAFAAVGALAAFQAVRRTVGPRTSSRTLRATLVAVVVVSAAVLGGATATNLDEQIQRNAVATDTYEAVYEPIENERFDDAVVFLPTPYGDWLNHPFQALRNDPDFDGRVVYAMDERPFAVVDEYPDRSLYRFVYSGRWAPYDGSPRTSRLQQVDHVSGPSVALNATVGVPAGTDSVTATVTTDEASRTYVAASAANPTNIRVHVEDDSVRLAGPAWNARDSIAVGERDAVRLSVFVDRGPGASFSYDFELPVRTNGTTVRAVTPRIERCVAIGECGGEAAYMPNETPDGTFVRTELRTEDDQNS